MNFVEELNDDNYNEFINREISLVDVWATFCGPCKQLMPTIEELSIEYKDRVSIGKLEGTQNKNTITELGVRSIPTIFLYKNGEIVDRSTGMTSKESLKQMIEKHL